MTVRTVFLIGPRVITLAGYIGLFKESPQKNQVREKRNEVFHFLSFNNATIGGTVILTVS